MLKLGIKFRRKEGMCKLLITHLVTVSFLDRLI